ncbi:rhomboid family intramembrane serine protease, partial [Mordavella massiliensis]|nr:rhomboid family intramembrane serine protease [Mordavella massiliensis]
ISAGASTGIFGLFGAFLMLGLAFWDEPAIHSLAHQFLILVLLNLGTDILVPGIDLAGHLGGLLGGFFMAAVVGAPRLGRMDLLKRFLSGTILIVTITVFLEMGLLK